MCNLLSLIDFQLTSFPFLQPNIANRDGALSGSNRQRGMFLNYGSKDGGLDPNWDPQTHTYKGRKSIRKELQTPPDEEP